MKSNPLKSVVPLSLSFFTSVDLCVERETEAAGKLRSRITAHKLTPTGFSALK